MAQKKLCELSFFLKSQRSFGGWVLGTLKVRLHKNLTLSWENQQNIQKERRNFADEKSMI